ncbi:hypothetical protein [Spirulina subsalsa]|uniref:hypothetical protein n=1 Tax=Spirulina subsalsa TaxID=54311 RepID=UPI0003018DFB|nr:hypothetical protein [Spirulina subsalsa]
MLSPQTAPKVFCPWLSVSAPIPPTGHSEFKLVDECDRPSYYWLQFFLFTLL